MNFNNYYSIKYLAIAGTISDVDCKEDLIKNTARELVISKNIENVGSERKELINAKPVIYYSDDGEFDFWCFELEELREKIDALADAYIKENPLDFVFSDGCNVACFVNYKGETDDEEMFVIYRELSPFYSTFKSKHVFE